jgi:hypothetical protein
MSDVFTNRNGRTWATHLDSPAGHPTMGDKKSEPSADNRSSNQHRIRIDVPMGTSYLEIQASIFRQAWQLAGTQLRAAIALGITPETISRALRACDRKRIGSPGIPKAWPGVEIDRSIGSSGHRVIEPLKTQAGDQPMNRWTDEPINEEEELKIDD